MNVKLFRRVKKHILANPLRLEMSSWIIRKKHGSERFTEDGKRVKFPSCGTAACISGWGFLLSGDKRRPSIGGGARLFGITRAQAQRLFLPHLWPFEFNGGATDDGKKKTAEIAAARIEHFIKTKGRE